MLTTGQVNRYLENFILISKEQQNIILTYIYQTSGVDGLYYVSEKTGISFRTLFVRCGAAAAKKKKKLRGRCKRNDKDFS